MLNPINEIKSNRPSSKPSFDLMDVPLWQEFLEGMTSSFGCLAVYDREGSILTSPTKTNIVCKAAMGTVQGAKLCKEYCLKAISKALNRGEPYIFECHTHQYSFAIPIILDKDVQLVIIGGFVYLSTEDIKRFHDKAGGYEMDESTISSFTSGINSLSPEKFNTIPNNVMALALPFFKGIYRKGMFEKRFYQMKSVFNVTSEFLQPVSQKDAYELALKTLGILFNVESASIAGRDGETSFRTYAAFGRNWDELYSLVIPGSIDIVNRVTATGKPEGSTDRDVLRKLAVPEGINSIHLFPLKRESEIFSLLVIFNTTLGKDDINLISALCRQLSIFVENISLKEDKAKRLKVQSELYAASGAFSSLLEPEALYDMVLNKSIELVGAEQGSLMILDEKDMALAIKATKGINKAIVEDFKVRIGEGISGGVAERGTPLVVNDIEESPVPRKNRSRFKTKSFVSIPLKLNSRTIGVLNLSDKITGEIFSAEDRDLLLSFASYASIALDRGTYFKMSEELKSISITDHLTGLLNRRYLQERLFEETERAKRHKAPLTLFMIDIDDFKSFNDRYGHPAGDQILKTVAHAIQEEVRNIDVVARYGGEEFTVMLPTTSKTASMVIAERIRKGIEETPYWGPKIKAGEKVTISLGIATCPEDADSMEILIEQADRALFMAKTGGKNRVVSCV
ncbi:MAG: diguanylate cyclase [Deltaproteobacteria bacterium]